MTPTSKNKRRISCPCCGSTNLCLLEDETYCRECGLVLQGVPSIDHYEYGYIIGGKRQLYTDKEDRINHHAKKIKGLKNNSLFLVFLFMGVGLIL